MSNVFKVLEENIADAIKHASLETASFGFPEDRIDVKHAHFGGPANIADGSVIHPDEYIKRTVELHHSTWIIGPLKEALEIIRANRELIDGCEELAQAIRSQDLERLAMLARGGRA